MTSLAPYRARILPEWIDYNGHLRDAYYGLVLSHAIDDVMDQLGLDAHYRERTHCTLYTVELHMRYLMEVKESDALEVETSVLDADAKRIHVGCRFTRGTGETVALGEVMLLHVHQDEKPASARLPPDIERKLAGLKLTVEASAAWGPKSDKIQLRHRARP